MARFKRVLKFDKKLGRMIQCTDEGTKPICDELSKDASRVRVSLSTKSRTRAKWPKESWAMGVDPSQISEAREIARRAGVQTDYTPTGEPILTGPDHYRRHAQAMGFYDRNGTWSPKNR